jgi:hypothetical protein
VAVQLTDCPAVCGLAEDVIVVALLAVVVELLTTWPPERVPRLAIKLPSPL